MTARRLALLGGTPAIPAAERRVEWPVVEDEDRAAVLRVLGSGRFASSDQDEPEVAALEREWATFTGTRECVGLSSGTAALAVALAAAGVAPGDEVLVPALSFAASALAPLHQLALPVFVDVDPATFTIAPADVARRIGPRTTAILPVHLHGLTADMESLSVLARRHGLLVIEDAAQAVGALYRGRRAGSLGDAAAFSLSPAKNLPTCGEGGLLTTDRSDVAAKARVLRQFGERIDGARERSYVSHQLGWNYKLAPVQAAFARSQLARFDAYEVRRQANVRAFLSRLASLPGVRVPVEPAGMRHVWHIVRLRFDPVAAGVEDVTAGAVRRVLHRVLRAEGVPISRYQIMTLPRQRAFREERGFGGGLPWSLGRRRSPDDEFPVAEAVIEDSLTLQRRQLNPGAGRALAQYADGFEKVWENLDVVAAMARAAASEPAVAAVGGVRV